MSLSFKIYSLFNGRVIGKDVFGNTFYVSKKDSNKRWVLYSKGFGPESLPTDFHNWLHNTTDNLPYINDNLNENIDLVKSRVKKHTVKKSSIKQGYSSWLPK